MKDRYCPIGSSSSYSRQDKSYGRGDEQVAAIPLKPLRVTEKYECSRTILFSEMEARDPTDDVSCDLSAITWDGSAVLFGDTGNQEMSRGQNFHLSNEEANRSSETDDMMIAVRDDDGKESELCALMPESKNDMLDETRVIVGRIIHRKSDDARAYSGSLFTKLQSNMRKTMYFLAKKHLYENGIFETFSQSGRTIDNTIFLLVSTLISNNRYMFDILTENGWLSPSAEKRALSILDRVLSQSNLLRNLLLGKVNSPGIGTKTSVVHCVNDIIEGSNELSQVMDTKEIAEGEEQKSPYNLQMMCQNQQLSHSNSPATTTAGDGFGLARNRHLLKARGDFERALRAKTSERQSSNFVTQIISMRNQVSSALQEYFQQIVLNSNAHHLWRSNLLCDSQEMTDAIKFLADPNQISGALRSEDKNASSPHMNEDLQVTVNHSCESSAASSSFLDFIDTSRLSMIFSEDEEGVEVEANHPVSLQNTMNNLNLDSILKRITLILPRKGSKANAMINRSARSKQSEKSLSREQSRGKPTVMNQFTKQKRNKETRRRSSRVAEF